MTARIAAGLRQVPPHIAARLRQVGAPSYRWWVNDSLEPVSEYWLRRLEAASREELAKASLYGEPPFDTKPEFIGPIQQKPPKSDFEKDSEQRFSNIELE